MNQSSTPQGIRREKLEQAFVYKSMEAIEQQRPARTEQAHRHDYFSIIYVQKGEGIHHIDFRDYPITEETIYFLSPEQIHHMALSGSPQGHVLLFTTGFLQQYSLEPGQLAGMDLFFNCDEAPPLLLPESYRKLVLQLIEQIREEYANQAFNAQEIIGALLKVLLLHLQRAKYSSRIQRLEKTSRKAQIVRQFKNQLEQNYRQLHKVNQYAQLQNLSSIYLNEVIKSETGISAKEFIQRRIILEAKRLALFSDWNMKEIAFHLGFEDSAHFSKLFKKEEGHTFSAFKANH